jgi:hypothetical protein
MTNPNDPYAQQGGHPQGQQPGGYPQQGGYAQQGQPGFPAPPPLGHSDMASAVKPPAVDTAYLLWLVAAGVSILANIIGFFTAQAILEQTLGDLGPEFRAAIEAQGPSYGGIIFSLIISAIWVVVVMQMRKGANWARILLTVLGAISVLFGILGLFVLFSVGFLGIIQGLLQLIGYAAIVGAIVFMFKPESNQYFKAS